MAAKVSQPLRTIKVSMNITHTMSGDNLMIGNKTIDN